MADPLLVEYPRLSCFFRHSILHDLTFCLHNAFLPFCKCSFASPRMLTRAGLNVAPEKRHPGPFRAILLRRNTWSRFLGYMLFTGRIKASVYQGYQRTRHVQTCTFCGHLLNMKPVIPTGIHYPILGALVTQVTVNR